MAHTVETVVDLPQESGGASSLPAVHGAAPLSPAYDDDYVLWLEGQMAAIRAGHWSAIDSENLIEEIASLGRSERNEIRNRLRVLLVQLLKWHFQPAARSSGWRGTIKVQREDILEGIATSPSLRCDPAAVLGAAYAVARDLAAGETGLPVGTFPETCPYAVEDILNPAFYPGPDEPRID